MRCNKFLYSKLEKACVKTDANIERTDEILRCNFNCVLIMRRFIFIFTTTLMFLGCNSRYCEEQIATVATNQQNLTQEQRARSVVLNMLNKIDPQTRSSVRRIASVETITFEQVFRNRTTRSDSSTTNTLLDSLIVNGQTALYVFNFENNEGTAVVEAPVFSGGELALMDTTSTNSNGTLLFITDSSLDSTDEIVSDGTTPNTGDPSSYGPDLNEKENFLSSTIADYLEGRFTIEGGYTEKTYSSDLNELSSATIGPLLTTTWHQFMPFNAYMPEYFDECNNRSNAPAGCATIAVAQFLVYMKNVSLPDIFNITNYSWDLFETVNSDSSFFYNNCPILTSGTIEDCVANFIRQVGDGIGVEYGKDWSEANIRESCNYLRSLGYNVEQYNYNNENRDRIITCLLRKNSPVIIRGKGSEGHQWLIDGYHLQESCSNDYYVHCNYGWEYGSGNGWYYMGLFNNHIDNQVVLDDIESYYDFDYCDAIKFIVLE